MTFLVHPISRISRRNSRQPKLSANTLTTWPSSRWGIRARKVASCPQEPMATTMCPAPLTAAAMSEVTRSKKARPDRSKQYLLRWTPSSRIPVLSRSFRDFSAKGIPSYSRTSRPASFMSAAQVLPTAPPPSTAMGLSFKYSILRMTVTLHPKTQTQLISGKREISSALFSPLVKSYQRVYNL